MSTFEKLVNQALLGTERQPVDLTGIDTTHPATTLLSRLAPAEVSTLLRAGAICAHYVRSGKKVGLFPDELPLPSEDETLMEVDAPAAARLRRLLNGEYPEFLPLWLDLATMAKRRAPAVLLPALFHVAAGSKAIRPQVAAVAGRRGVWLARQNPVWKFSQGATSENDNGDWNSEHRESRALHFKNLRINDPAAARGLLEQSWKELAGPERAELIAAMSHSLSMDDHDFLESRLNEKRIDVRQASAVLLALLPGSSFGQRMEHRARAIFGMEKSLLKGARLEIELPVEGDAALERDGARPKSSRATLLQYIIQNTSLGFWETEFTLSGEKFLKAVLKSDFAKEIVKGLLQAASLQREVDWAWLIAEDPDAYKLLDLTELGELLQTLTPDQRETFAQSIAGTRSVDSLTILQQMPTPWSASLSRIVVKEYLKPLEASKQLGYGDMATVRQLASALSAEVADEVFAIARRASEGSQTHKPWTDFETKYAFRIQLEKEFSSE